MSSNINISLENPYGQVTIPRAKLRSTDDIGAVIANPMALNSENPYAEKSSAPPPYMIKESEEENGGRCPACCYRCCRRK